MTRDEARKRSAELNRGSGDRASGRWIPQDFGARGWRVVHVRAPALTPQPDPAGAAALRLWPEPPPGSPSRALPGVPPTGAA